MKLYTFEIPGQRRIGAEWEGQLIDLATAYNSLLAAQGSKPGALRAIPTEMLSFIRLGALALEAAREAIHYVNKRPSVPVGEQLVYPFDSVKVLAPVPRTGKILCAGVNYHAQLAEMPGRELPAEPVFSAKFSSSIIGAGEAIQKPGLTEQLDSEVELAAFIGKPLKNSSEEEAIHSIFGYTILNDVSARDFEVKSGQLTLGRNFDTFCPLGPCIVTADELTSIDNLRLTSMWNGNLMQEGSTADWIFPLPKLLSFLSRVMTLEPGDIVSTGSPAGAGTFRNPPIFLKAGDKVVLEIEGIGRLENPVKAQA